MFVNILESVTPSADSPCIEDLSACHQDAAFGPVAKLPDVWSS